MPKLCRCWSERYSAVDARWSDDFVCPRCGDFFFSFFFASFLMTAALSMRPTSMSGDGAAVPNHGDVGRDGGADGGSEPPVSPWPEPVSRPEPVSSSPWRICSSSSVSCSDCRCSSST